MTLRLTALTTLACLLLAPAAPAAPEPVDLTLLGRTAAGGEAAAEIAAFDPATRRAFATNAEENTVDAFDFSDPSAPSAPFSIDLSPHGAGPNGVAYSPRFDGIIAVAVEAEGVGDPGSVEIFDADGNRLTGFPAGALPDMVTFASHGRYLLVANEGEPADDGSVDPEGSVTVIDLKHGLKHAVIRTAGLDGVPLVGPVRTFTPGSTVAQDLEPEYIATEGERAWVSIQEANAIGILDIAAAEFEQVRSLGFKDHGLAPNGLDASDQDGGPNIQPWPNLLGMYQPDAIAAFTVGKGKSRRTMIATANEGDSRDFEFFSEESRVNALALDPNAFPAGSGDNDQLGRLNVTTTLGDTDGDGDYDLLYAFGARSMSLLEADGSLAYDTGDELEQLSLLLDPGNFNKSNGAGSAIDNRSDDKGPEPEAVTTGRLGGRTYAFVGAERSGMIYAYDLDSTPGEAELAGWINTRTDDLGPEGIAFVSADDSPTSEAMLLVTYEISGTVAAYGVAPAP
jgi:hypothetical protein